METCAFAWETCPNLVVKTFTTGENMIVLIFIALFVHQTTPSSTFPTVVPSSITSVPERRILITKPYGQPYFDTLLETNTNVTAQLGSSAFLVCKVKNLGNKSVSFLRTRDAHIISVDRFTFIADSRFSILHNSPTTFTMSIKYVQPRDQGFYECQVTTNPKLSLFIHLQVVVPQTRILGESDVFVKSGSQIQIKCVIYESLEEPDYVFWYHDGARVIAMPSVISESVERLSLDTTLATLVISVGSKRDAGNYTCAPSKLEEASVVVHVINGEHPAAMQQNSLTTTTSSSARMESTLLYYLLFFLLK